MLAYNHSRPNADINGLRDALSPSIRVGRSWSGKVGGQEEEGAWDQPDGYRTLIHEFGHYALGLWDSYFRIVRDEQGNQKDQVTAHCTGPEIQSNGQPWTNATLMDYQYNASDFSMKDSAAWNEEYLEVFEAPYPCRTTVTAPPVFGLIEVELIAALEPRR